MVVLHHVVQYQGKKQEKHPDEGKEKRPGQRGQTRQAVDIDVVVENAVQQHPTGGNEQHTEEKFRIVENFRAGRHALDTRFSPDEKQSPGQHRHEKIGDAVKEGISFALTTKQGFTIYDLRLTFYTRIQIVDTFTKL